MKAQRIKFETKAFDLTKFKKDMADFNARFPPVKGMMYDLDGNLEPVSGADDEPRTQTRS